MPSVDPSSPDVSVIVPVFNAAPYLEEAVESVLAEGSRHQLEVVLIEDGSRDGSLAICQRLSRRDARVRLLRHPHGRNLGPSESRNLGIRAAKGSRVAFLDADDSWLPGRLDAAMEILDADPTLDGVYDAVQPVFEAGAPESDLLRLNGLRAPRAGLSPEEVFEAICNGRCWHTNGILLRRGVFDRAGMFAPAMWLGQDRHLWIRVAAVARLAPGVLDHGVATHRRHGANRWQTEGEPDRFPMLVDLYRWMVRHAGDEARLAPLRAALIRSISVQPPRPRLHQAALKTCRAARVLSLSPRAALHPEFLRTLATLWSQPVDWRTLLERK